MRPPDPPPDPSAPKQVSFLPAFWDARRAAEGKPDRSRCAAELRAALTDVSGLGKKLYSLSLGGLNMESPRYDQLDEVERRSWEQTARMFAEHVRSVSTVSPSAEVHISCSPYAKVEVTCSTCGAPWALGQSHACGVK